MRIKCINCNRNVRIENAHKGYGPVCAERLGLVEMVQKSHKKYKSKRVRKSKIQRLIDERQLDIFETLENA